MKTVKIKKAEKAMRIPKHKQSFCMPTCAFADVPRCRDCGHYDHSDSWCYLHETWTSADKWVCDSY